MALSLAGMILKWSNCRMNQPSVKQITVFLENEAKDSILVVPYQNLSNSTETVWRLPTRSEECDMSEVTCVAEEIILGYFKFDIEPEDLKVRPTGNSSVMVHNTKSNEELEKVFQAVNNGSESDYFFIYRECLELGHSNFDQEQLRILNKLGLIRRKDERTVRRTNIQSIGRKKPILSLVT